MTATVRLIFGEVNLDSLFGLINDRLLSAAEAVAGFGWPGPTPDGGGQSGLINDSGTGTIFDAATNGLLCLF